MPQNTPFVAGPIALTGTYTTNVFNPGTTTGGVNCTSAPYDKLHVIVRKIRVVNVTSGDVTFRLYRDSSGGNTAGKALFYDRTVPANQEVYEPCYMRLGAADFLVGGASAGASLNIELEGEIGVGA